jgi:hypothetical protein
MTNIGLKDNAQLDERNQQSIELSLDKYLNL